MFQTRVQTRGLELHLLQWHAQRYPALRPPCLPQRPNIQNWRNAAARHGLRVPRLHCGHNLFISQQRQVYQRAERNLKHCVGCCREGREFTQTWRDLIRHARTSLQNNHRGFEGLGDHQRRRNWFDGERHTPRVHVPLARPPAGLRRAWRGQQVPGPYTCGEGEYDHHSWTRNLLHAIADIWGVGRREN